MTQSSDILWYDRLRTPLILAFFGALLILGISIHRDYGAHWDEQTNQRFGTYWGDCFEQLVGVNSLSKNERVTLEKALRLHNRMHAPFFDLVLFFAQEIFLPKDTDQSVLIPFRHLCVFLCWYTGVIVLFYLCKKLFSSSWWALFAALLFVLNPRTFSDAFYNSSDMSFMVLYLIATATLLRFMEKKDLRSSVLHGVAMGCLIDIRASGLIMGLITGGASLYELWTLRAGRTQLLNFITRLVVCGAVLIITVLAIYPHFWKHTGPTFMEWVHSSSGTVEHPNEPPTSPIYTLKWLVYTTPIAYVVFILAGLPAVGVGLLRKTGDARRGLILIIVSVMLPLTLAGILRPFLYDGWRHHYFLWPELVILCVLGLKGCLTLIHHTIPAPGARRICAVALWATLVADMAHAARFMVRMHPHEHVFTSMLAPAGNEDKALDYWGLSMLDGFRYILKTDPRHNISVLIMGGSDANYFMLTPDERKRLHPAKESDADYAVTCYRARHSNAPMSEEEALVSKYPLLFSLKNDSCLKFLGVYRMKEID